MIKNAIHKFFVFFPSTGFTHFLFLEVIPSSILQLCIYIHKSSPMYLLGGLKLIKIKYLYPIWCVLFFSWKQRCQACFPVISICFVPFPLIHFLFLSFLRQSEFCLLIQKFNIYLNKSLHNVLPYIFSMISKFFPSILSFGDLVRFSLLQRFSSTRFAVVQSVPWLVAAGTSWACFNVHLHHMGSGSAHILP